MSDLTQTDASEAFAQKRAHLRLMLMRTHLLDDKAPLKFVGTFGGSGDSGSFYNDTGNDEVDSLFSDALEEFVTFDWYNNEGGGGDITWEVNTDKITINGYYNETVATEVMVGVEF